MSPGLDPAAFNQRIYDAAIGRFSGVSGMQVIVDRTRALLEAHFHPFEPTAVHQHFRADALATSIAQLQRSYGRSDEILELWRRMFVEIGFDPDRIARDRLVLRFQPPADATRDQPWHRSTATVRFHRDTWGTNLYAQVNWWAPIYRLEAGRTLYLYPALWNKPIANDSSGFDINETLRRVRDRPDALRPSDLSPTALSPVGIADACPVLIEPGEIIAFSAQHAHAAVPNQTPMTRISVETRTLTLADIGHRGAPNIDGAAPWMTPGFFKRLSDGVSVPTLIGGRDVERCPTS